MPKDESGLSFVKSNLRMESEFKHGSRTHLSAGTPKRNLRYIVYTATGATAGAVAGGKRARIAGLLGGTILGFIIAGRPDPGPRNLTLKAGQQIRLELAEDLAWGSK